MNEEGIDFRDRYPSRREILKKNPETGGKYGAYCPGCKAHVILWRTGEVAIASCECIHIVVKIQHGDSIRAANKARRIYLLKQKYLNDITAKEILPSDNWNHGINKAMLNEIEENFYLEQAMTGS